jgi:UDP-2,3-diacylglucosamine hydrolase
MTAFAKIGIIAGGGELPVRLAQACRDGGIAHYVARIEGFADPALKAFPGAAFGLGAIETRYKALKAEGVDAVVMAGIVKRPDFKTLQLDLGGVKLMPRVLAAARQGDDALLSVVVKAFEENGFKVLGAEDVFAPLLGDQGPLGRLAPDAEARADLAAAARIAAEIGRLDIGQGAVVCDGLVLAVEAQEGTDAMLARVAGLPAEIRGAPGAKRGVLVKRPKPQQERRIDLPTIGLQTIDHAARAGLAGVAFEAGGALILDKAGVAAAADEAGLFVYGFGPDEAA